MKQLLFLPLIILFFSGCEPAYSIRIWNRSASDLYLKTHPSVESHLYDSLSSYSRDSILTRKIKQDGKYALYKIKPNSAFDIDGMIGWSPALQFIHYDYIALIRGRDTMILDSKEKIFQQIRTMDIAKRRFYIGLDTTMPEKAVYYAEKHGAKIFAGRGTATEQIVLKPGATKIRLVYKVYGSNQLRVVDQDGKELFEKKLVPSRERNSVIIPVNDVQMLTLTIKCGSIASGWRIKVSYLE